MTLTIGHYTQPGRVIVAPMAGVTDRPFRNLCRNLGATWCVGEMVTSDRRLWHTRKSQQRLAHRDEPGIRWVQLAGAEPSMMADAARANRDLGAQIIDINMGCPAKKVCHRAAGSALLRDERLVGQILDAVVAAVDIPVTLKIRLGWSRDEINAVSIGRIAESAGIRLLTVHGRTRACRFTGDVDYSAIGEVKAALGIPVVANGDIDSAEKAAQVLAMTGADGVMIGRGAQGRPWLPGQVEQFLATGELPADPELNEVHRLLCEHLAALYEFYGEPMGVRIARKHVGWCLDRLPGGEPVKKAFNCCQTAAEQAQVLRRLVEDEQVLAA